MLHCAIADGSGMFKAICYDARLFPKLSQNASVMINNYVVNTNDKNKIVVLTRMSRVYTTSSIEVDEASSKRQALW